MKKVGILGAGAWGTAIGKSIAENGHDVELWSFEQSVADEINERHKNSLYLPDVELPTKLRATTSILTAATEKDFLIVATPSLFTLDAVKAVLTAPNIVEGETQIGVVTKGFITQKKRVRLIVETLEDYLPGFYKGNIVYISGPSHAEEVARGKLTGLISASANPKNSIRFRQLLNSPSVVVFSSLDVIGVQVCAAVKNVIAIAFGILDALKERSEPIFGDNTESLLLAAGLNEIQSIGIALGSTHPETFTSIAGVGDLDVTCRSPYGRNRRFGRDVVLKNVIEPYGTIQEVQDSIKKIGYLPEGLFAVQAAREIAEKHRLKLRIVGGVYRILNREAEPDDEIRRILTTR